MNSALDEDELRQLVSDISAALAEHGPEGQKLAVKMMDAAGEVPFIQLAVAITMIRCYLEDHNGKEPVNILLDTIYNFARMQIDANKGTPQ